MAANVTSATNGTSSSATAAAAAAAAPERNYGGYTRFELELEFVQTLANPLYLNHLASQKYFDNPDFVQYLKYLQYFAEPQYLKYLSYPGPTLRVLELLQIEQFRREILVPEVVDRMIRDGFAASTAGLAR